MGLLMHRHASYRNRNAPTPAAAPPAEAEGEARDIHELPIAELRELAAHTQIDLGKAKTKAQILEALETAFVARANAGNPVGELVNPPPANPEQGEGGTGGAGDTPA